MTRNSLMFASPLVLAFAIGLTAPGAYAQSPGMGGPMGGGMDGRMGRMAERMKEGCERFEARLANMDKKLSTDQVRDIVAGQLAQAGNANIKVGKVQPKGEGVVAVDIVTKDGALVNTRELSTKTGMPIEAGKRCDKIEERIEKAKAGGAGPMMRGLGAENMRGRGGPGGRMVEGLALMGAGGPDRDLNLSADQVKKLAEARLIMLGNPNLKVGSVKEKDADTYTVSIVTTNNSLVVQRDVNKHNGRNERD